MSKKDNSCEAADLERRYELNNFSSLFPFSIMDDFDEDFEEPSVKVPIKEIVLNSARKNDCVFDDDDVRILRAYFIALLNMKYIEYADLKKTVDFFTSRIKFIVWNKENELGKRYETMINNYDIVGTSIVISYNNDNPNPLYETKTEDSILFAAITEVLFDANRNHSGFEKLMIQITSSNLLNMQITGEKQIMPATNEFNIGSRIVKTRTGYEENALYIGLLRQLFMVLDVDEELLIRELFMNKYKDTFQKLITSNGKAVYKHTVLYSAFDVFMKMEEDRFYEKSNSSEVDIITKYELLLNLLFDKGDEEYAKFLYFVPFDDLKIKMIDLKREEEEI